MENKEFKGLMGEEKIERNVERLERYLFNTLGCSKQDVLEIVNRLIKKLKNETTK